MDSLFSLFGFFASGFGLMFTGAIAGLMILLWDWRASLIGLVIVQLGVSVIAVLVHDVVPQWAIVQTLIMVLCSLILALSGNQVPSSRTLQQSGNWLMRVMALIMLIISWRLFEFQLPLPEIDSRVTLLFLWLAVCALLTLSLSDNPLFTGAALLLWLIPVQAITSILIPLPSLIIIVGALQLFLALAASYLILTEVYGTAGQQEAIAITDITFPQTRPLLPSFHPADPHGDLAFTELPTLELPTLPAAVERTGEHPLVERLNRRKRAASSTQQVPVVPPPTSAQSSSNGAAEHGTAQNGTPSTGATVNGQPAAGQPPRTTPLMPKRYASDQASSTNGLPPQKGSGSASENGSGRPTEE